MIDYVKTIIYKICCNDETIKECYVGHTTNFKQRKIEHKFACCNENSKSYNCKVYSFIRDNGGFNNWTGKDILTEGKVVIKYDSYWFYLYFDYDIKLIEKVREIPLQ